MAVYGQMFIVTATSAAKIYFCEQKAGRLPFSFAFLFNLSGELFIENSYLMLHFKVGNYTLERETEQTRW